MRRIYKVDLTGRDERVSIYRDEMLAGVLTLATVIRAAAYRGGLHMRDERCSNF